MLVAGVKVATQTPPVRSGRRVVFVTLDDSTGPADATFFSVIDDDGGADRGRCVNARYAGLFGDGPDQSIAHVSDGRLCPDGHGGLRFEGRYRITGGLGAFDGIRGRGRLVVLMPAD